MIREMIFQSVTLVVRKKNASTVTIRFSTQGAHSGQGAYFLFGKQPNVHDKSIIFI